MLDSFQLEINNIKWGLFYLIGKDSRNITEIGFVVCDNKKF